MTNWSELNPRDKATGLPTAVRRSNPPGSDRFTFIHDDLEIDDPSVDVTGRFFVSPREYGFSIRGFQGGKTAWSRDFENGTMLVVNAEGLSHVLSPKAASRILFIGANGEVLQDSGNVRRSPQRPTDLTTVRLVIHATFDLRGESPEVARTMLMRMVDRAIVKGTLPGETDARSIDHTFESSAVLGNENARSSNTDFSQLLDR
jgi:hypothetical protein